MKWVLLVISMLVIGGCLGGEGVEPPTTAPSVTQPPTPTVTSVTAPDPIPIYKQFCVSCHGLNGQGDGVAGASLDPPPRDFTTDVWKQGGSLAEIESTIRNGVPGTAMVGWAGTLTDEETKSVAEYVKSFSQ
jgi:cytochrome c